VRAWNSPQIIKRPQQHKSDLVETPRGLNCVQTSKTIRKLGPTKYWKNNFETKYLDQIYNNLYIYQKCWPGKLAIFGWIMQLD